MSKAVVKLLGTVLPTLTCLVDISMVSTPTLFTALLCPQHRWMTMYADAECELVRVNGQAANMQSDIRFLVDPILQLQHLCRLDLVPTPTPCDGPVDRLLGPDFLMVSSFLCPQSLNNLPIGAWERVIRWMVETTQVSLFCVNIEVIGDRLAHSRITGNVVHCSQL